MNYVSGQSSEGSYNSCSWSKVRQLSGKASCSGAGVGQDICCEKSPGSWAVTGGWSTEIASRNVESEGWKETGSDVIAVGESPPNTVEVFVDCAAVDKTNKRISPEMRRHLARIELKLTGSSASSPSWPWLLFGRGINAGPPTFNTARTRRPLHITCLVMSARQEENRSTRLLEAYISPFSCEYVRREFHQATITVRRQTRCIGHTLECVEVRPMEAGGPGQRSRCRQTRSLGPFRSRIEPLSYRLDWVYQCSKAWPSFSCAETIWCKTSFARLESGRVEKSSKKAAAQAGKRQPRKSLRMILPRKSTFHHKTYGNC